MWKIVHAQSRKSWRSAPRGNIHRRSSTEAPTPSVTLTRRIPADGEPLAYCADCREWTPMQWLPKGERGRKPEQWFQCEYCGGRSLTLRYLPLNEAMRRAAVTPAR